MRRKIFRLEKARVGFFHHDHAFITSQFPRELALADIHGKNFFRAALQQTIRKTAGGRAEINRREAGDVELKMFQRVFELVTAATHKFLWHIHGKVVSRFGVVTGLARGMAVHTDFPSEDEPLGLLATVAQAAFHEGLIKSGHENFTSGKRITIFCVSKLTVMTWPINRTMS